MRELPWDYPTAVERCRSASLRQEASEQALVEAGREFAITEERYRLSLAQEIVRQHSDGVAWTVCDDISRGQPEVAKLRRERDIAEGVREAMTHACWRRNADRRDAQRFADWSQRVHCPFCGQISANTRSKVAANRLECEASNKRGRAAETAGPMATGGSPMQAQRTAAEQRARRIEELWGRGLSIKQIATDLRSTPGAIGVAIIRLRARGYTLPYRYQLPNPLHPTLAAPDKTHARCPRCEQTRPLEDFPPAGKGRSGYCRTCGKNYRAEHWQRPDVKDRNREWSKRWARDNPEKVRAQSAIGYEVRVGRIVRPERCSRCEVAGNVHAHHEDYSKPLEVKWLCVDCHAIRHIEIRDHEQSTAARLSAEGQAA